MPFQEWLDRLRDVNARQRIQARIARLRLGNFGDSRSVGGGVHELRIDYGPGYRLYFGQDGPTLIILLCGGDKKTQSQDIVNAHDYWARYKLERKNADR